MAKKLKAVGYGRHCAVAVAFRVHDFGVTLGHLREWLAAYGLALQLLSLCALLFRKNAAIDLFVTGRGIKKGIQYTMPGNRTSRTSPTAAVGRAVRLKHGCVLPRTRFAQTAV